jgi:hypothetical protein
METNETQSKKFVYVGDPTQPNEPLETKEAFGLSFEPGEAVEVTDPEIIRKLEGNNHFAEEGKEPAAPRKAGRPRKAKDE